MTSLGLGAMESNVGEIRVGFRSGLFRSIAITAGGAGLIGLALGVLSLAQKQPAQVFELLSRWGFVWLLVLAAMFLLWDLLKVALGYLGKLADSVSETAVAMNRIADKDDRERDRMITETAFVGQRLERMSQVHEEWKAEQRQHNERVEAMLNGLTGKQ